MNPLNDSFLLKLTFRDQDFLNLSYMLVILELAFGLIMTLIVFTSNH